MEGNPLELREVTGDVALLDQIYALRVLAWRTQVELPADMNEWRDAVDAGARHWAFTGEAGAVAAVRLSLHASLTELPNPEIYGDLFDPPLQGPIAYYSRGVVHPSYRGLGLHSRFHPVCLKAAENMGAANMVCTAGSIQANQFVGGALLRAGFELVGEGRPYSLTPYAATTAPSVFVRHLKGIEMRSAVEGRA